MILGSLSHIKHIDASLEQHGLIYRANVVLLVLLLVEEVLIFFDFFKVLHVKLRVSGYREKTKHYLI